MHPSDSPSEEVALWSPGFTPEVAVNDPFFPKVTRHRAGETLETMVSPPETNALRAAASESSSLWISAIYRSFINRFRLPMVAFSKYPQQTLLWVLVKSAEAQAPGSDLLDPNPWVWSQGSAFLFPLYVDSYAQKNLRSTSSHAFEFFYATLCRDGFRDLGFFVHGVAGAVAGTASTGGSFAALHPTPCILVEPSN